jgi:hypothetical protein
MGEIGFRKKGDSGPLYNPERDYAYVTPTLMRVAIENLDELNESFPADKEWRIAQEITAEELFAAAESLAKAQRDFVNAADPVTSLTQALTRHGFYLQRPVVRNLLFASIGEVFCAAWFKAVREVSNVGEESPAAGDMARFAAAVRVFAKRHGAPPYDEGYAAEALQLYNDVLQTRLNVLYDEHKKLQAAYIKLEQAQQPSTETPQPAKTFIERGLAMLRKALNA